jgi:release factor glutamine methyltransferase
LDQNARQDLKDRIAAMIAPVAGESAAEEAEEILTAALAGAPAGAEAQALAWAGKRVRGAPLGLAMGRQSFLGVTLTAREDVLMPRQETELLGREALAILAALEAADPALEPRVIDMGCGSGNLSCALASASPRVRVWASDLTESCAALTRDNATLLGLQERILVSQGDLFDPLRGHGLEGSFDLVLMNPPYIPSSSLEKTHAQLLEHEPRAAFDGGPYGISILTRLLQDAPAFLKPGGHLLFEFGLGQAKLVQRLAERGQAWAELRFATDAQGEPRVGIVRNRLA